MKHKNKTQKKRRQYGRGIIDGIRSKTKINDVEIAYIKKCPTGFVMCDQDEVNSGLCVPKGQEGLCGDPNYLFRYVPPDENDRNALMPKNRLIREENGKGPIQDPDKNVRVFDIEYDGEPVDDNDPDNPINKLQTDVLINEETGRLKSYAPEYHPTSCAIQQKSSATIEKTYKTGDMYKRRSSSTPRQLEVGPIPSPFKIVTQNALGLYRGEIGQPPEPGSVNEATYDLMALRTALFRDFLKKNRPDFVCLQESTPTFVDLLDKDSIPEMYPYLYPTEDEMLVLQSNGANANVSMFSKYPARKSSTFMLQGNSSYFNSLGIYEFDNLVLINVYMQAGSEISPGQKYKWENYARCRRQQLMFIKQQIDKIRAAASKAIVVLGDFNFELNSIRYEGEKIGRPVRDQNNHLIYDPANSDMKWAEHKFLVGEKGLNLNDSYKELYLDSPSEDVREGYTEYTDVNTFRFLGKLEEKKLRYDGIFFNDDLRPIECKVVNDTPTILDNDPDTISLFVNNGITDYENNIQKYNTEYANYMIFNPKGNVSAQNKKDNFLSNYKTRKGKVLSVENGFELFVSDHFGVMAELEIKGSTGGKKRKSRRRRKNKRRQTKRR
jgi:endonuclease/exonuclease/phosphatase family metal-dependent hydrolase